MTIDRSARVDVAGHRGVVNADAEIVWDSTKPDGTARKLVDVSKLNDLGWVPTIDLATGLESTYRWYLDQIAHNEHLRGIDREVAAAG